MNTYSFRAEAVHDITEFMLELEAKADERIVLDIRYPGVNGSTIILEVHVELQCKHSYGEVLAAMEEVPDARVMIETLRECKLEDNSLVRSMNGGLY